MERGRRKVNEVFGFAVWWFNLAGEPASAQSSEFRALLGKASRLKKDGYDLTLVKRAILTMKANGVVVTTPYAIKWQSPTRGQNWYKYSIPAAPPLWDGLMVGLSQENAIPLRVN